MKKFYSLIAVLLISYSLYSQCAFTLSVTPVDASCFSLCDGSASVSISGGTGPFTYQWNPGGATTTTITGLCPGTFWCVIEELGCKDSVSFTIDEPDPIVFTPGKNDVSCFGDCTGSITPSATGGITPYTFSVSGGMSSSLCAGNYTAYVTDDNGCMDSTTLSINEPAAVLSISVTSTDVTCFGTSNGTGSATVSGGTSPYNYSWSTNPPESAANAFNLNVGTTTVVVTDNAGCTDTATVLINQPTQIVISTYSTTGVSCYGGNDGSSNATATGGVPSINGYTFVWTPGGHTGMSVTGLSGGTHTVSVTDSLNCTVTQTINVPEPAPFIASAVQTNFCGGATGDATVNITGGTPGFSYLWSPGSETTQSVTGLSPGTYTVLVTDTNSCTASDTVNIIVNPIITTTLTTTNITCLGDTNGTASVAIGGGTPGFTYLWLPTGDTVSSISGLAAGDYTITVTDTVGCASTHTFVIGGATLLSTSVTSNHICSPGVGSTTVTASGGTPGYQYSWNSGNTTSTLTGLSAGTYTCIVTDSAGCVDTTVATILQSADLVIISTVIDISCAGDSNAVIALTGSGGIPGYTYLWSPGGGTSTSVSNLGPSSFTITITDSIGCTAVDTITITDPAPITLTVTGVDATCFGCADGTASANASGGTGSYTYSWSNGATTANISGLVAGTYTVCVTDGNGCDSCSAVTISEPPAGISRSGASSAGAIQISPNPFGNSVLIKYENTGNQNIVLSLNNIVGETIYKEIVQRNGLYVRTIDTSLLPAGIYFVSISNNEGILTTKKVIKTTSH